MVLEATDLFRNLSDQSPVDSLYINLDLGFRVFLCGHHRDMLNRTSILGVHIKESIGDIFRNIQVWILLRIAEIAVKRSRRLDGRLRGQQVSSSHPRRSDYLLFTPWFLVGNKGMFVLYGYYIGII